MELAAYIADKLAQSAENPRDNLLGDLATACPIRQLEMLTAQVMLVTLFSAGTALIGSATRRAGAA